jgi:hypothetical protein
LWDHAVPKELFSNMAENLISVQGATAVNLPKSLYHPLALCYSCTHERDALLDTWLSPPSPRRLEDSPHRAA